MTKPIGEDAKRRFTGAAALHMRTEIDDAGGREVFFCGTLDASGLVTGVRVCARGNEDAVPAILDTIGLRDVVIHNHPGDDISPSDPDLDIASICAHDGHGVYIVDNAVERIYVVVEPFLDRDIHRLDPVEMGHAFEPASRLARALPHFEVRPQQRTMMDAVARAFNQDGIAVIEAPTGIGKTFAYLIPAIYWAVHNRERVVISTRTINLQEQIMLKDIPVLQKSLPEKFQAALVKGRGNYVCRRKLARALSEMSLLDDDATQEALKTLDAWANKTEDGSRSDLPFVPTRDIWERVCSEADTCVGNRCPSARQCFVTKARREVAKADLIVANHHILFSDVAVKKETGDFSSLAVLPSYKRVILDEAHSIEDSATEYFGVQATRTGALALLGRFIRKERVHERGLIPSLKIRLIKETAAIGRDECDALLDLIDNHLLPALAAVREAVILAFDALRSITAEKCGQIGRDIKWRLTPKELGDPDLREMHKVYVLPAIEEIATCLGNCTDLITRLRRIRPARDQLDPPFLMEISELAGYRSRLEYLAKVMAEGTGEELLPNTVRWIEIDSQKASIVRIIRCPLDVGGCLAEWMYDNLRTAVMTSATLSVQHKFDYLFRRIGLDRVDKDRVETAILDSPFEYDKQALLCIMRDMISPDERGFQEETVNCLREILERTRGYALVLFTSFSALDFTHRRLEPELRRMGIRVLKQGEDERTRILNRFREDLSSVLFGTDSFWEGVDVAGDALQCVILPKLPFRVPTEPIQQARAEAIETAGGNSFVEYTVPQAVIKFRQGFGRLIRRKTDRGVVVVLDRRIVTRFYGRKFLDSLPGVRIVSEPRTKIYEILADFYAEKSGDNDES